MTREIAFKLNKKINLLHTNTQGAKCAGSELDLKKQGC